MPTAMPPAPLTSRFGKRAGRTRGSLTGRVVVVLEIDGVLVDVVEQLMRDLVQARTRCSASAAGGSPSIEPKLPCPSISGTRSDQSCAMRTSAS